MQQDAAREFARVVAARFKRDGLLLESRASKRLVGFLAEASIRDADDLSQLLDDLLAKIPKEHRIVPFF
jgi:hypothetical protein